MRRNVRPHRLPDLPPVVLQHLKVLRPPEYADLVAVGARDLGEGSIICVDVVEDAPTVMRTIDKFVSESNLAQICRYHPCALITHTTDLHDLVGTFSSRPFLRGFRAVLVPGMPWRENLRAALTEEQPLAHNLTTWMIAQGRDHRLDRPILKTVFSLPADVSLAEGLYRQIDADTVAAHLKRLHLPSASKLKMLGVAVRACMRLQRNPERTVESVARSLGYASGQPAVSGLVKRTFGVTTTDVREKLGWEWLMGRWESLSGRLTPTR